MTTKQSLSQTKLILARDTLTRVRHETDEASLELHNAIHNARVDGMTLQAIGDVLGLSRQRVKQLLDR